MANKRQTQGSGKVDFDAVLDEAAEELENEEYQQQRQRHRYDDAENERYYEREQAQAATAPFNIASAAATNGTRARGGRPAYEDKDDDDRGIPLTEMVGNVVHNISPTRWFRFRSSTIRAVGSSISYILICGAMWYVGAATTVDWIAAVVGLQHSIPGLIFWVVPIIISFIELDHQGILGCGGFFVWLGAEAVDMITSFGGISGFLDGKSLGPILFRVGTSPKDWFVHWNLFSQITWFNALCLVLAVIFALVPEKLADKHKNRIMRIVRYYWHF